MKYQNKKNGKIGTVTEEHAGSVLLEFEDGTNQMVSRGTLKRWYKALDSEAEDVPAKEEPKEEQAKELPKKATKKATKKSAAKPKKNTLSWDELVEKFKEHNAENPDADAILAHIVISADSFTEEYTEAERTYVVSSNNNAFRDDKKGDAVIISAVDGTDDDVRLDWYDWEVESAWIVLED